MKRPKFLCSDFFLDILYPNRCPGCGCVVGWNEVFCKECEDKLEYLENVPWQSIFPSKVNGHPPNFDYANALFRYEGMARKSVLAFKNKAALKLADFTADRLPDKFVEDGIIDGIYPTDIVTAVPMHRSKRIKRGYNQAEVLARALADRLKLKCDFKLIGHNNISVSQHQQENIKERYEAADSTYYICKKAARLDGKNVILCDDIFTTGATVDKCSELLKELGAKQVYIAAICRTIHKTNKTEDTNK